MEPTVVVSQLKKSFRDVHAVRDVSFEVYPGEVFGLLGPNGAGKTTTIRMLLDIFKPDNGTVTLFGGPITETKKNRIGYLPEERGLYQDAKLETTLVYLATLKGMEETTARRHLGDWLKRLDLYDYRHKRVKELSKGMQQKAQIIATFLHDPDLVIIDEPFSGLDPLNTRLIKEIITEQQGAGKTIIMSTHQMHQVELLCNRIALINQGRSVIYGEVDAVQREFSGHAVILKGRGEFSTLPGVLEAHHQNGTWELTLKPDTDPQVFLRTLANRKDIAIEKFEIARPSLEDIFITVVKAGGNAREEASHE